MKMSSGGAQGSR